MPPTVLITRPDPAGTNLANELRTRWGCGVPIVLSPVLRIEWLDQAIEQRNFKTLIFTSRNGVAALSRLNPECEIPAYAVGDATAKAARQAGYDTTQANGDSDSLVARMIADKVTGPCMHIRGEHTIGDVAARLTQAGIPTQEMVLYRQVATPLNREALDCLNREAPVILPLYSPRSATLIFDQLWPDAPVVVAAISPAVAANVPKKANIATIVADRPDGEAMLGAIDAAMEKAKLLEGANRAQ